MQTTMLGSLFLVPLQAMHACVVLVFVSNNICVVQALAWLLLPLRARRTVSAWAIGFMQDVFVYFCDSKPMQVIMYGDEIPNGESAIVLSNHLGAEWMIFAVIARSKGALPGLRFIQKHALKYVPVNWCATFHEHLFVHRGKGPSAALTTRKNVGDWMTSMSETRTPMWLGLFPEGTWVAGAAEAWMVERSDGFCAKAGKQPLRCVLAPRVGAYEALVDSARAHPTGSHVQHLYDLTLAYSSPTHPVELGKRVPPSSYHYLNGGGNAFPSTPMSVHVHVRRIPLREAHDGKEGCAEAFMWDWAERKEKLLREFERAGCFAGPTHTVDPTRGGFGLAASILATHISIVAQILLIARLSPVAAYAYVGVVVLLSLVGAYALSSDEQTMWEEQDSAKKQE